MTDHQDILAFPPSHDAGSSSNKTTSSSTDAALGSSAELAKDHADDWSDEQATLKFPNAASLQSGVSRQPFTWQDLNPEPSSLSVVVRLGKKRMLKSDVARLGQGDIVTLDRPTDDWVEVVIDSQVVAIGRMVVAQGKIAIEIDRVHQMTRRRSA